MQCIPAVIWIESPEDRKGSFGSLGQPGLLEGWGGSLGFIVDRMKELYSGKKYSRMDGKGE